MNHPLPEPTPPEQAFPEGDLTGAQAHRLESGYTASTPNLHQPGAPEEPGSDSPDSGESGHLHIEEPRLRDLPVRIGNLPRFLLLLPIRGYQATFSRTLPPDTCRFYPTCSHYGYQAIYKYGALKGGLMAAWRILRCNPFNPGGFDPVP